MVAICFPVGQSTIAVVVFSVRLQTRHLTKQLKLFRSSAKQLWEMVISHNVPNKMKPEPVIQKNDTENLGD